MSNCPKLQTVVLQGSFRHGGLGAESGKAVAKTITKCPHLQTVDLRENNPLMNSAEAGKAIVEAMLLGQPSLQVLKGALYIKEFEEPGRKACEILIPLVSL